MPIDFDETQCIIDYLKLRRYLKRIPDGDEEIAAICKAMAGALTMAYNTLANEFTLEIETRREIIAMANKYDKWLREQGIGAGGNAKNGGEIQEKSMVLQRNGSILSQES